MRTAPICLSLLFVAALLCAAACDDDAPPASVTQVSQDAGEDGGDDAPLDSGEDSANNSTPEDIGAEEVDEDAPEDAAPEVVEDTAPDVVEDAAPDVAADTGPDVIERDTGVDAEEDAEVGPTGIAARCFSDIYDPAATAPDYDQFNPTVAVHCGGTNHQNIAGVEQVVFLGDSVTQGTPNDVHPLCVDNEHFYRSLLAEWLAERFELDRGEPLDWAAWKSYSCLYNGEPGRQQSGDFFNCSKWGARTDDLLGEQGCGGRPDEAECCARCCHGGVCGEGGRCVRAAGAPADDAFCGPSDKQIARCVPQGGSDKNTLFVFTMGGNDIAAITQDGAAITSETEEGRAEIAAGYPSMWALARSTVDHLDEAIRYLKDPARFPGGSHVVFANPFEFTDATGDVSACSPDTLNIPGFGMVDVSSLGLNIAELGGFGAWERPEVQRAIVIWITEQFMRIAVEQQADMIWMLEHFCGHGYVATGNDADTANRCYREDDPTLWFDVTCIHPNETGHRRIFELFRNTVRE